MACGWSRGCRHTECADNIVVGTLRVPTATAPSRSDDVGYSTALAGDGPQEPVLGQEPFLFGVVGPGGDLGPDPGDQGVADAVRPGLLGPRVEGGPAVPGGGGGRPGRGHPPPRPL